jgi:nicotinamidase-related amidase
MQPALWVIDVQREFYKCGPVTAQSFKDAIETINAAITLFRARQLPIVCTQHMDQDDQLVPGAAGVELPAELNIFLTDVSIYKTYGNSFNKTGLIDMLRAARWRAPSPTTSSLSRASTMLSPMAL